MHTTVYLLSYSTAPSSFAEFVCCTGQCGSISEGGAATLAAVEDLPSDLPAVGLPTLPGGLTDFSALGGLDPSALQGKLGELDPKTKAHALASLGSHVLLH